MEVGQELSFYGFWPPILTWGEGRASNHQQAMLPHQLAILTPIPFWHCLPGESVRSHRLGDQSYKTASHKPRLSPVLLTNGYKLEVLTNPAPCVGYNLLERLTELRETLYLLDYRFIIKGRYAQGKVWGKDTELPYPLRELHSPHLSTCSRTWKLAEPCPLGFL